MKSFLILLSEKQPDLLNESLLNAHISYLQTLQQKGHLLICGPFIDNQGAMMIINTESKHQAEGLIKNDPFIKLHYYQKYAIHEFTAANEKNNWLFKSS